jgi:hypothetical protein
MAQRIPAPPADALGPLAMAALGADSDPEMREYVKDLIRDRMVIREKEKKQQERMARNAVQAAEDEARTKANKIASCNHMKQDNRETRLVGQFLSGTGQLCTTCQWCGVMFHNPPLANQTAAPLNLLPHRDGIGG